MSAPKWIVPDGVDASKLEELAPAGVLYYLNPGHYYHGPPIPTSAVFFATWADNLPANEPVTAAGDVTPPPTP